MQNSRDIAKTIPGRLFLLVVLSTAIMFMLAMLAWSTWGDYNYSRNIKHNREQLFEFFCYWF